jgi:ribosome-associated toxin RatA of RatAB toxin-antitoxin module
MPVLTGSSSAEVEFAIERCWALVADIERAPQWQRTLERVEVVERDDQGRALICDTVSDAKLTKVRSRVRVSYEPPRRVRWTQVSGDDLDSMEGSWELEPLGAQLTRATYELAVDPGPIGFLARPLERAIRPLVIGRQAGELAQALAAGR